MRVQKIALILSTVHCKCCANFFSGEIAARIYYGMIVKKKSWKLAPVAGKRHIFEVEFYGLVFGAYWAKVAPTIDLTVRWPDC